MKRLYVIGLLCGFLLLVLATLFATLTQSARAADTPSRPVSMPMSFDQVGLHPLEASQTFTCSVNITTTDSLPNNQSPATAATVANYSGLALVPSPTYPFPPGNQVPAQDDWFVLGNVTPGFIYTFEATPDAGGNYNLGMQVYTGTATTPPVLSPQPLTQDINTGDGNSTKIVTTFSSFGPYYIKIFQISNFCSGGTYTLKFSSTGPTSTASPTPSLTPSITPTSLPFGCQAGVDRFEPNDDFDTATTIGLSVKYDNLNFLQCISSGDPNTWDNDFFKVRVKPGMLVTCKTLTLSPGTDTNLILWDDSNPRNGINGSDDVNRAAGDLSSSVSYYVTYQGSLYAEVGEGFHRQHGEGENATYSFECDIVPQTTPTPTATPTEGPGVPTRTPVPTITPTPSVTPTPTPPFIVVRALPTPTPPGLPTALIPVSLQVYYDANNNNKPDPGEGVIGVSARVFDLVTGQLLTQGFTDDTGRVSFTVSAPGAVHLIVPYLNFGTIILPSGGSAVIRISPHELPQTLP